MMRKVMKCSNIFHVMILETRRDGYQSGLGALVEGSIAPGLSIGDNED